LGCGCARRARDGTAAHRGLETGKGAGWSLNRSGPAVAADLRTERGPDGPELVADLGSGNDKPAAVQPAFRVAFVPGHRYRITLDLAAGADTRVVLLMRRTEKPYEPMIQRTVQLTARSQRVELEGVWPYIEGTGEVRLSAIQPKARLRVRSLQIDDLGEAALGTARRRPGAGR
jgi:hypothetical protein